MTRRLKHLSALAALVWLAACAPARSPAAGAPEPATTSPAASSCASADASATKPSDELPAAPPPAATSDLPMWRARQLRMAISAQPRWPADLFTGGLYDRRQELEKFFAELAGTHGPVVGTKETARPSPQQVELEVAFEDGVVIPVSLGVTAAPPHAISKLWFGPPIPAASTLPEVRAAIAELPGKSSLAVCELGADAKVVVAHHPDEPLAIGSAFKLYVLGALLRDIESGQRRWGDQVRLEARFRSLPSGTLHTWPEGSPITLHTLAALMISASDNTATDHLLFTLGRRRVEAMLGPMGNSTPARNRPFLSTAEVFRLKDVDGGKLGDAFLTNDEAGRRAFLSAAVASTPLDRVGRSTARLTDRVEWFASTHSLCRAMNWLRRETEKPRTAPGRAILAINPGLRHATEGFEYVGFKGGGDTGALNSTFLLKTEQGTWWAFSATWNDTKALDKDRYFDIVQQGLRALRERERR